MLGGPGQQFRQVLGLDPAREHDLADFPVQVSAAAWQRAAVAVHGGDHRQQQRVHRQVVQGRIGLQQLQEPGGGLAGPYLHGPHLSLADSSGGVPFGGQVPAVQELLDLLGGKRPHGQDVGVSYHWPGESVGPGGDHEMISRVTADLPLYPCGDDAAVLLARDFVQPVEQDHAPAAKQLPLPPALGLAAGHAADRGPHDIRQGRPGAGRYGPGVLAQRQQDGQAPPVPAPGPGTTASGMSQQGALPAPGRPGHRQDHPLAAIQELADRMPTYRILCNAAERVAGNLVRGPADQRDVHVDSV